MLYGWAVIPFVYVQSFLCTVAATAYIGVTMFNIFTGKHSSVVTILCTELLL